LAADAELLEPDHGGIDRLDAALRAVIAQQGAGAEQADGEDGGGAGPGGQAEGRHRAQAPQLT
jgi:hypothetical protein